MRPPKQKYFKPSLLAALLLSAQFVIANEDDLTEQKNNAAESNEKNPNLERGCDPWPECNHGPQSVQSADWFAMMMQMLNEKEENKDKNDS